MQTCTRFAQQGQNLARPLGLRHVTASPWVEVVHAVEAWQAARFHAGSVGVHATTRTILSLNQGCGLARYSLPQHWQSRPIERIEHGSASNRSHQQFGCPPTDFLPFTPRSVHIGGPQANPSQPSQRYQTDWHRTGQEVQRDCSRLRIEFQRKSKRDSDVAAMGQDFGQQARCLRWRPPVSVIGEIAQTCGDLGSWPLRVAARRFIDCPVRAATVHA
jgi:hypothetical protein